MVERLFEGYAKHHGLNLAGVSKAQAVKEIADAEAACSGEAVTAQLEAITDPIERTRFYRSHKTEIDAATSVANAAADRAGVRLTT